MNEDYLRYLTTSDSYMGYPLWTTNPCSENYLDSMGPSILLSSLLVKPKRKDVSFIKKEIPKFKFPKEPMTISFDNVSDEDMEYFRGRLLRIDARRGSLKLPSWLLNSSYGIISDPTPQIFDEFH